MKRRDLSTHSSDVIYNCKCSGIYAFLNKRYEYVPSRSESGGSTTQVERGTVHLKLFVGVVNNKGLAVKVNLPIRSMALRS